NGHSAPEEPSANGPDSNSRDEERRLIARAVERDAEAFTELYDRNVVRVYRHIYYLVNDIREAEDLTAQTFLKAWEAIDRYKERGAPIIAWLLRIAHNLTISFLRSRREHGVLDEAFIDQKLHRNPEDAFEQSTDEASVRRAILNLRDE